MGAADKNAWVRLRAELELARLIIEDDGRGYDQKSVAPGHFGLAFMQERADETSGELVITSAVGDGTLVRVDWQLV